MRDRKVKQQTKLKQTNYYLKRCVYSMGCFLPSILYEDDSAPADNLVAPADLAWGGERKVTADGVVEQAVTRQAVWYSSVEQLQGGNK